MQYPRGTAQVAIPEGEPLTVAKAAVPPRTPPYRPRKNLMFKIIILSKEIDVFLQKFVIIW